MYHRINSSTLSGLSATPVTVECDISDGLPVMDLVGYLGSEVKEARERVRTALKNSGFPLPVKRITVNISPAGIRKQGTAFDFPIALAMMVCMELTDPATTSGCCVMGELGLDGSVQGINGVLPRIMSARDNGCKTCLIPRANINEAAIVDGIDVIGVSSLAEALSHLNGKQVIKPVHTDLKDILRRAKKDKAPDFSELCGQPMLRRCLEIAAAGRHNVLMIGPPGAGKTMAAKRLPGIMPPLTEDECLELTKIYSIAGLLPEGGIVTKRPFVSPHHTSTPQALAGGGSIPRPGAVSLAHRAVLFLDELPEFSRESLEVLRQPMEDKQVNIARAAASYSFPADFLLIAAMNPCRCGYYPDKSRCSCTESEVRSYMAKISGPMLDRIDLCAQAEEMQFDELIGEANGESTDDILERVMSARELQNRRFAGESISSNGEMNQGQIMKYCLLGEREQTLLKSAFKRLRLSARAYHRVLRCARTVADLAGSPKIKEQHLYEALSLKLPDKNYMNGF